MSDGCSSRLESANTLEKLIPSWRFLMWSAGEEVRAWAKKALTGVGVRRQYKRRTLGYRPIAYVEETR
jgi:hypothetical protein